MSECLSSADSATRDDVIDGQNKRKLRRRASSSKSAREIELIVFDQRFADRQPCDLRNV